MRPAASYRFSCRGEDGVRAREIRAWLVGVCL